ncbi:hypothetical protein [Parafrankia elaeagni]|uniref:hypothetical protein n=1 Tax=Parafrankia elaeagni TaxID=222534 RepID=UPI00035C15B7|nr:hypothetical protein [Parafrankia elaeagni]
MTIPPPTIPGLDEAGWTARFARQQQRNAQLGATPEALGVEFSRLEELRRREVGRQL